MDEIDPQVNTAVILKKHWITHSSIPDTSMTLAEFKTKPLSSTGFLYFLDEMNHDRNKLYTRDRKFPLCNPKWRVQWLNAHLWLAVAFIHSVRGNPILHYYYFLFNSIEYLLDLRQGVFFPQPPRFPYPFLSHERSKCRWQFIQQSRTNGFLSMYVSDLWEQGLLIVVVGKASLTF